MKRAVRLAAVALVAWSAGSGCGGDDSTGVTTDAGSSADDVSIVESDGGSAGSATLDDGGADVSASDQVATTDALTEAAVDAPGQEDQRDAPLDVAAEIRDDSSADAATDSFTSDGAPEESIGDAALPPPMSKICALDCNTTSDCRGDASNSKLICDPIAHRCVACTDDLPCIAGASSWTRACTTDAECPPLGEYCVDIGGSGVCAFDKSKIGTLNCSGNPGTLAIKKLGSDGETVEVCARLTNTCDLLRGRCEGPCTLTCTADGSVCTSACTATRGGKICNPTSKRCECATDGDCSNPTSHCNPVTHQCECGSGAECMDGSSVLVCK